ncbi:MAG: ATP-binding protein [Sporichthyaceae bacterium]
MSTTSRPAGDQREIHIDLLGRFDVTVDGVKVPDTVWPGRRSAELVQLLALADRHVLLREQVIDALWPHLEPAAGAANLRKAAHQARTALHHEDAVVLAGGRVALFPRAVLRTDVMNFEQLAETAVRSGDPAASALAAAACTGVLLPDARYADWAQERREHLSSRHRQVLRSAGLWERLIEVDPTDELAYRELMRGALAAGNRHAAIRWYGRMRTVLQAELGVAPDAESRALYADCVAGLDIAGTAYVGRDLELGRATAALTAARAGALGALVIRGPAGIGKSALCRELASTAGADGWATIAVTAETGCGPYAPLVDAVDTILTRDRGLLEVLSPQVRSILAELTTMARPAQPLVAGLSRHMVFGAVHRLLMEHRASAGVLLVLDDVHLADDGTAEALAQLARAQGPVPLLVVVSYRPEAVRAPLAAGVGALERAGLAVALELGPLPAEEMTALLQSGACAAPAAEALPRIVALAGGNPFFALELARAQPVVAPLTIPRSVWEAVTTRFLDLGDAAVAMLRRLAVVDHDLDPTGVLALTGLAEPDAFAFLDDALTAGALIVDGARYRFRHDLVRHALAEQVPPHERIAIHRDAARRLAAAGAEPALIAQHWLDGDQPAQAAPYLVAAARRAAGLGAFAEALRHVDTVLGHDPTAGDALRLRAEALEALGDLRAPQSYARAAEVIGGAEADNLRAKQALAQVKQGDPAGGVVTLQGLVPTSVDGRLAEALAWAGAAVLGFATPDLGTAKAAESRRLALQTGDHGTLVIASWAQAAAAHARGDLRGSVWADLLDTSTVPDLAISAFDGHLCISQRLLYGTAPYPDVIAFADAFEAEADRVGAARGRAYAVTLRGEAELLSGHLDAADVDLRTAARLSRDLGGAVGEALAVQRRAELELYRDRPAEARALLDDALAVARESNVGFHLLDRIYGARILAARDRDGALAVLEDAESSVQGPLETCPGCRITLAVPAAIAAARAGDHDRLERWMPTVDFLADVVMKLPAWNAARDEVRGHYALATEAPSGVHFAAAAAGFTAVGQPQDAARCAALAAGNV